VSISTYTSLASAVPEWMARAGDTDIGARFDDLLALHEERMYFGTAALDGVLPAFEPLRIREMETANSSFALAATVAQPTGFLELIEAKLTSPIQPLDIVAEGVIDGYRDQSAATPKLIAVSGTNFRVWPDPGSSYTAVLRYFAKLTTPSATNSTNWILTNAPSVYLNGCLLQAALYISDLDAAKVFGSMYAASVKGLNERRNSELRNASNVRMRVRGRTP
jgi:hypothetical protein